MTTTITNVRLAAGDGPAPAGPVDVEFGTLITAVRPAGSAPAAGRTVDGTGYFLVPGLIDTHVHLGSRQALRSALGAGVTTLVDLGTHPDDLVDELRADQETPAIISAGSAASAPGSTQVARMGFPAESGVTGAADAERFLDWRVGHGADLVKIIIEDPAASDVPALDVPTLAALVEGAHRRGLLTVAHVTTAAAFERGLDAGVDVLTHAPFDRPLPGPTVQRMLAAGTVASPTLVMMHVMARALLGDRAEEAFGTALESARRMHAAGVPVVAGTDANETPMAPVAHGASLHEELRLLQEAGMTPAEALTAATSGAAAAFRLDDRGRIAEGLRADLVLVDGDPVAGLERLATPTAVWLGGAAVR